MHCLEEGGPSMSKCVVRAASFCREGPACASSPPCLVLSGLCKKGETHLIGGFGGAGLGACYEGIGFLILAVLGVYGGETYVEQWHACSCNILLKCLASSRFCVSQFHRLQRSFQPPAAL